MASNAKKIQMMIGFEKGIILILSLFIEGDNNVFFRSVPENDSFINF
jgi:hypothetical protein